MAFRPHLQVVGHNNEQNPILNLKLFIRMARIRASTLVRKASSLQRVNDCHRALESPKKSRAPAAPHLEAFRHKSATHATSTTETTPDRIQTSNVSQCSPLPLSVITTASEQTPRLAKGPAQVRVGLLRFTLSRMELSFHCIAQSRVPPTQEHQQLPPGEQRQG